MSEEATVFVVDDDETAAASAVALLMSEGHNVQAFHSAEEFLAAYDGSRKACLVLDVRLKGMSGPELQDELAARGWKLPVILISGHMDLETARPENELDTFAYLEKPFAGNELCEAVHAAQSLL